MQTAGQITIATLHDLALLYLGLAHGADGQLDPQEKDAIAAKLRQWQPDKDPALIDHVIREATLTYLNGAQRERLDEAIGTLKASLSDDVRTTILHDLSDIAYADGRVVSGESSFIRHIADLWDLDADAPSAT